MQLQIPRFRHLTTALTSLALLTVSCRDPQPVALDVQSGATRKPAPPITADIRLKDISRFPVGMQCYAGILDYPVPANTVGDNYSSYTAAAFFWNGIEPQPGSFDFAYTDKCVAFAQNRKMRLHGHPLVYFQNGIVPDYITNFNGTKAEFEALVKTHIQTVVGRYKGKFASYDVVNEMVDDYKGTRYFNNYIDRFYLNDTGYEEFIGKCFVWAHEADPGARLFYNEAKLELSDHKRLNAVLTLLRNLKKAKIPIDGIGTQMHTDIYRPQSVIDYTLNELANTKLAVHISELDVSINEDFERGLNFSYESLTPELAERQKATYQAIVVSYRKHVPQKQQWGITMWDLMDHTSWLNQFRKEFPCLHDSNCDKKPAYYGFAEGLVP